MDVGEEDGLADLFAQEKLIQSNEKICERDDELLACRYWKQQTTEDLCQKIL